MNADVIQQGTALCQSCGFCCDGTLFDSTSFSNSEETSAPTQDEAKKNLKPQPCSHHSCETGCQIYLDRPRICRTFRCFLLDDLLNEKRSIEESLDIIAVAKKHRGDLLTSLESRASFVKPLSLKNKFLLLYPEDRDLTGDRLRENADAFLAFGAFEQLKRKHFISCADYEQDEESKPGSPVG